MYPNGKRLSGRLLSTVTFIALPLVAALALVPASPAHAAFPGANGKIVFVSDRDGFGNPEIYAMNGDGTSQVRLTNNPANDYTPAWSPDGTRIVFGSTRDQAAGDIYVMNADGTSPTRLTSNAAQDRDPTWSRDGSQIVFVSTRDGNDEIYVMNADGTNQTRLTSNAASDSDPAWSPDGTRIAFTTNRDGNSEIYAMNADGLLPIRLTTNAAADAFPAWSPDGTRIAFARNDQIYFMNADGTSQTTLTSLPGTNSAPAWSPDGTRIAIHSTRTGSSEIYSIEAKQDGDTPIRLTFAPPSTLGNFEPSWQPLRFPGRLAFTSYPGEIYVLTFNGTPPVNVTNYDLAIDEHAAWSPLGTQIAFNSYRDGALSGSEIYVMNADGSGQTRLTNSVREDDGPAWSPDGTRIAFRSARDQSAGSTFNEIYVMNSDGTGQTRLTNNSAFYVDEAPAWSPDSTRIAYHVRSLVDLGIRVMNADGSNEIPLTSGASGSDLDPAWSPDGTKIAFTSYRDSNAEIYVMNADGSGQTRLTSNPAFDGDPTWSPDGAWIAFSSDRDGNNEIYFMRADGSQQTRLTKNTWSDTNPAWQLGTDTDGDGAINVSDTCLLVANPSQLDANHDGYGNFCDADLNNSGFVTTADFGILRSVLGQPVSFSATAAAADMNGSGTVTTADFGLLRARLGTVPGPSGLSCAGTGPCP